MSPELRNIRPRDMVGIRLRLASPEEIKAWSRGEVTKGETINYRTQKPEPGGLFCEKIFGPVKDYQCSCGKYKGPRFKGITCDRCGVEVTSSQVRRERMGHIELAVPVAHIWYYRVTPSPIALLLDMKVNDLEAVLHYDAYVVLETRSEWENAFFEMRDLLNLYTHRLRNEALYDLADKFAAKAARIPEKEVHEAMVLKEWEYRLLRHGLRNFMAEEIAELEKLAESHPGLSEIAEELKNHMGYDVKAEMGAEPIRKLLAKLTPERLLEIQAELRSQLQFEKKATERTRILKKIKVVDAFIQSGNRPEHMILTVLPVIPPDLRPLVPLEGNRYATSDVNDLYRRVISRNNRLKYLMEIRAPELILNNEKRLLQEAVDALLDNARRRRPVTGKGGRKLKSLSDNLRGKKGLLRRNLLGKRVDYSGRSVIVVGPHLKLHQVGLPKEMAIELFRPMVERKLEEKGIAANIREARRMLQERNEEIWAILEEITRNHPVFLNRAPTLHRPSIQAFEPVLVEGKAIQLHPLVCTAYNADFDGDQMAVFVPILPEAQLEAYMLVLAPHNIISPAHGRPLASASQDMVIGINYLTKVRPNARGTGRVFYSVEELAYAVGQGYVDRLALVKLPAREAFFQKHRVLHTARGQSGPMPESGYIETTYGRIQFNEIIPEALGYFNYEFGKKDIASLVLQVFRKHGTRRTAEFLEAMKALGFHYATQSGLTFGMTDMVVPEEKEIIIREAFKEVEKIERAARRGIISKAERYQKILDVWTRATDQVKDAMIRAMARSQDGFNPIHMMVHSGARGNVDQVRQVAGMRGLMARPTKSKDVLGDFIETPIISNFREGLSVLEYFISTHGARKGLSDTALKTADAGYLTRKLVDVAHEVVVVEEDCGTPQGRRMRALKDGDVVIEPLSERIVGRVAAATVRHPETKEVLVPEGEVITPELAEKIDQAGVDEVVVRSVLYCASRRGVCAKCYGWNLATGRMVEIGEAVGVIAAQSIGEPGTQLTLRTFHTGGAAERVTQEPLIRAPFSGTVRLENIRVIERQDGERIVLSKQGRLILAAEDRRREFEIPHGAFLRVTDGETVERGTVLAEWEVYALPVIVTRAGVLRYQGLVEGITLKESVEAGRVERIVQIDRQRRHFPEAHVVDPQTGEVLEVIPLVEGARLIVQEGEEVHPGDVIARLPREVGQTRDITGGLPRVTELFEARTPKNKALISEISGRVKVTLDREKKVHVVQVIGRNRQKEYTVPYGRYLLVADGEWIEAGTPITTGPVDPKDLLRVKGKSFVQEFLMDQIQQVYRTSGVSINDKHIEVIVRQMSRKVRVEKPGHTPFVTGDIVDQAVIAEINRKVIQEGGKPAQTRPVLLGLSRTALNTESFISAASFQETTKVLAQAAIAGKVDHLRGLKENVIVGNLIPAGTGTRRFQRIQTEVPEEVKQVEVLDFEIEEEKEVA